MTTAMSVVTRAQKMAVSEFPDCFSALLLAIKCEAAAVECFGFHTHFPEVHIQINYSAVKRVEFVNNRMSYIVLRGRWFHIIVLNVHAPTEDKTDDVKHSFYEELERIIDKFPKYHMKILLGDLNAKVGREDIFKPTIGN
jgi:hypothetical protein